VDTVAEIASPVRLLPQPRVQQGVGGRDSDSKLTAQLLGWEPNLPVLLGRERNNPRVQDEMEGPDGPCPVESLELSDPS
jgi:hypothetical protein